MWNDVRCRCVFNGFFPSAQALKRSICIAFMLATSVVMADDAEQACVHKPIDTRSTTVKVFNGITQVLHAIDPTVWIARGILLMIPGQHNAPSPKYCEDAAPQDISADSPATTDAPASQNSDS